MPFWLLPVEYFGKIFLKYGLEYLETKYPGSKAIIDLVIKFLDGAVGNPQVSQQLQAHVASFVVEHDH